MGGGVVVDMSCRVCERSLLRQSGTSLALPVWPASAATQPSGSILRAPVTVDVTLKCKPGCDEVKVDNAVVDAQKPLKLAPGTHDVELKKAGFLTASEKIEVKAGTPLQQTFTLTPEKVERPSTGTPTTPTTTSKPSTGGGKPPCKKGFITKC